MTKEYMTKEEMYTLYPRKWLLINDPRTRDSDGAVLGGELLGIFEDREEAWEKSAELDLRHAAIRNSIQEE